MKNSKKIIALALILSMFLVSCNNDKKVENTESTKVETTENANDKEEEASKEEIEAQIIVVEDKDENLLSKKEIKVKPESTLYEALKDNFDIVVDDTGMLTSIDGKSQDKEKNIFWTYTVNDEMIMQGIKDYVIQKGDNIKFKLSVYEG